MSPHRSIRNLLLIKLSKVLAWSIRMVPSQVFKEHLNSRIFSPYCAWRTFEVGGRTWFGAKMLLLLPDVINKNILLTGRWEPSVTNVITQALAPGDVFIDVGANIGYYTLLASWLVGGRGKVYAIEASPTMFARLKINVGLNSADNVTLLNFAVSDVAGTAWIWSAPLTNSGHSTMILDVAFADGHQREAEVATSKLSGIVPLDDLLRARLIKIDIEGAERLALSGIQDVFEKFSTRTEWVVEFSPKFLPGKEADSKWIYKLFADAGHIAYAIPNSYRDMYLDSVSGKVGELAIMDAWPVDGLHDVLFSRRRLGIPRQAAEV